MNKYLNTLEALKARKQKLSELCFDFQDSKIVFEGQAQGLDLAIKLFKQMERKVK